MLSNQKQTLPKYRRIKSGEDFGLALKAGRYGNKWFVAYARENKAGVSRLGMVVSKKIVPNAADRNYVKRQIREKFRQEFPVKFAFDIVIRLRNPFRHDAFEEKRRALVQLLNDIQTKCVNF